MTNYKQYDPLKVKAVAGVFPLRGFADGNMMTIAFDQNVRSKHIGADGDGRHVKNADRSGTITVRLAASSPSNAVLQGLHEADEGFPFAVADKASNADLFFAASTQIQKIPDMSKGNEETMNEWVLQFIKGKIVHTGAKEV